MDWHVRHEGSSRSVQLRWEDLVQALRDGIYASTDEVKGPQDGTWVAIENHPQLARLIEELEAPPSRHGEEETRLDMNALIDVCLVLLIFFILTTTHATAVQKLVPLPTAPVDVKKGVRPVSGAQVKKYMIRVQALVDAAGKPLVRVEEQPADVVRPDGTVDVEKLGGILRPHVRGEAVKTELLLDARGVNWGQVVAIQDAARLAGVRVVHHLHHGSGQERESGEKKDARKSPAL